MSAPSTSGLSVELLLRVIDDKYGCFAFCFAFALLCFASGHVKSEARQKRRRAGWERKKKNYPFPPSFVLSHFLPGQNIENARKTLSTQANKQKKRNNVIYPIPFEDQIVLHQRSHFCSRFRSFFKR